MDDCSCQIITIFFKVEFGNDAMLYKLSDYFKLRLLQTIYTLYQSTLYVLDVVTVDTKKEIYVCT